MLLDEEDCRCAITIRPEEGADDDSESKNSAWCNIIPTSNLSASDDDDEDDCVCRPLEYSAVIVFGSFQY